MFSFYIKGGVGLKVNTRAPPITAPGLAPGMHP